MVEMTANHVEIDRDGKAEQVFNKFCLFEFFNVLLFCHETSIIKSQQRMQKNIFLDKN